jgi:NAD(P)-dependent dehydrogenase (short-subunit alcohol dehydrogenase family)
VSSVYLVTGASRGFGLDVIVEGARKGFTMCATMRSLERDRATVLDRVRGLPGAVHFFHLDVTNLQSIEACVRDVLHKCGRIDVLVNNAGFGVFGPVEAVSESVLRGQMETNFFGLVNITRAVLPHMRQRGSGKIINLSSIAGVRSFPGMVYYCTSKFAVEGFTEGLSHEIRPFGLHAVLVEPGRFRTDFNKNIQIIDGALVDPLYEYMQVRMTEGRSTFAGAESVSVARKIIRIGEARCPRLRYVCGLDAKTIIFLHWLLPEFIYNAVMRWSFFGRRKGNKT